MKPFRLLEKALELEPDYAAAQAQLARCFQIRFSRRGLNEADRAHRRPLRACGDEKR